MNRKPWSAALGGTIVLCAAGTAVLAFDRNAISIDYSAQIAPILNRSCVPCHRQGEVGPFSLTGYENAKKWAPNIVRVTKNRRMPPWKPVAGHGVFLDENRLTEAEIRQIDDWAKSGAPRGNPDEEPPAPTFATDWELGPPDLELTPKASVTLPGDGGDEYRSYVFKTDFKETRYLSAFDCKPLNRSVVHHVLVFLDNGDTAMELDRQDDDGQEGFVTKGSIMPDFPSDGTPGFWAPGMRPRFLPPGVAFKLKPGASFVMQVHYHKTGKTEIDRPRFGFWFAKEPVTHVAKVDILFDPLMKIPAGAKAKEDVYEWIAPADLLMYRLMPHMHMLGRRIWADVVRPDGSREHLVRIDDWDFAWQMNYSYKEPVRVPKGSVIELHGIYDNTADNPNNPNSPPKEVRFGMRTIDEMLMILVTWAGEKAKKP